MVTIHDVAAFILKKTGAISVPKLHRLLYYAQAWSLVWDGKPLFRNQIKVRNAAPIIPSILKLHEGLTHVGFSHTRRWPKGNPKALNENQIATIEVVLNAYADFFVHQLSSLFRQELRPKAEEKVITHKELIAFYGSLGPHNAAPLPLSKRYSRSSRKRGL